MVCPTTKSLSEGSVAEMLGSTREWPLGGKLWCTLVGCMIMSNLSEGSVIRMI